MGKRPNKVEEQKMAYWVECGSNDSREAAMGLDGWNLQGHALKLTRAVRRMTAPEIFRWLSEELQIQEDEMEFNKGVIGALETHKVPGRENSGNNLKVPIPKSPERAKSPPPVNVGGQASRWAGKGKGEYQGGSFERRQVGGKGQKDVPPPSPTPKGGKGSGKGVSSPPNKRSGEGTDSSARWKRECFACKEAGYDCEHDYSTCPWWNAQPWRKGWGGSWQNNWAGSSRDNSAPPRRDWGKEKSHA